MASRYDSPDEFAKAIWGKREEGLPVPEFDLQGEITPEELDNLQRQWAFIQVINPDALGEFTEIEFIKARSGWLIINYHDKGQGGAICASPAGELYSQGTYVEAQSGELERVCSGTGTTIMKIISTAAQIVQMAKEQKWPSIQIINGHPEMKWGIWKATQDLKSQGIELAVTGYEPSIEEVEKYKRIQQHCPHLIAQTVEAKPAVPSGQK